MYNFSKSAAKSAAIYFYNYHVAQLNKLPADLATASKEDQDRIIYHEKAAMLYLWNYKDLS